MNQERGVDGAAGDPGEEPKLSKEEATDRDAIEGILAEARKEPEQPRLISASGGPPPKKRRWWHIFARRRGRPTTLDEVVLADHDLDVRLKSIVARWSVGAMVGQLAVADAVFVLYAWLGVDWKIEPEVILGWLSATVVEVIGIVVIVARYLFPKDGHVWSRPPAQYQPASTGEQDGTDLESGVGQQTEEGLKRLAALRFDGILTDEEYAAAKRKLLGL